MTDEQLRRFRQWFTGYVASFREDDPLCQRSLDLKEKHTACVMAIMDRITAGLALSGEDRRTAAVIALFHDLGRFPQYSRYRTFRDRDSENHAKLSLRELTRLRMLRPLAPRERRLIGRAIIFHNHLRLPSCLDPETRLFCRLIRDADKVDILRVMLEEYGLAKEERNPVVLLGLNQEETVRDEVYQRLFHAAPMSYNDLATANEFKVLQLSWVFDINFRPTLEILQERDCFAQIAATLPPSPLRDQALACVHGYIERCLHNEEWGRNDCHLGRDA